MHRSSSILTFALCLLLGSHSITLADEKQSEHEKAARAFIAELRAGRFEAAENQRGRSSLIWHQRANGENGNSEMEWL
jgi:hypothetical protein